ncbi:MAG: hypothetical protein NZZ41_00580 [Candidatus Dojkabacteria bacterium]|nr:hypothetical protein [Candidatus Dojkabacteria bacterium]
MAKINPSEKIKIGTGGGKKLGTWRIDSSLKDATSPVGRVSLIDFFDYDKGQLIIRGLEAGPGIVLDVVDADDSTTPPNVDTYKKIRITSLGGGGGLLFQDEGVAIPGIFTTVNFVGPNVLAQPSSTPGVLNVFIPPPSFLSHWNTNDGSNGAQFVNPIGFNTVLARISNPLSEGNPFLTGGWAGTNQLSTQDNVVTFTTPGDTTGFGGNSTMTVQIIGGNGTPLVTWTTPPITGNGTFTNGAGITVNIANFGPDATRFKAKATVTVNINSILSANGYQGGRFRVSITHTTDTATDGTGPYNYLSGDTFLDVGSTPPVLDPLGSVLINETPGAVVTKFLSGIEYYTLGSQFTLNVNGINQLNANVQRIPHNVELRGPEYGLPDIDTAPYTVTPNHTWVGWSNLYNVNNVNFIKTDWTITATNYRYIGPTGNISVRFRDPWNNSPIYNSPDREILIDTYGITSTNLAEFFDDENRRQTSSFNEPSGLGNWNSANFLNPGEAIVMAGLLQVPNQTTFVRSDGPNLNNSNWTSYLPNTSGPPNPNYSSLGVPVNYYRTFIDPGPPSVPPLNKANFIMTFTGTFASGSALNDLINGHLEIFIRRRASAGGGNFGPTAPPLWLHAPYNFLTFDDGNTQTPAGAGIRLGSSVGNTITGTYGGFSCETGMLVHIRINHPAIKIDSIVVSY